MPTCGNVWVAFGVGLLLGAALFSCVLGIWSMLYIAGEADRRG